MSKAKSPVASPAFPSQTMVPVSGGWSLVKTGSDKARLVRPKETAVTLLVKAAKALGKPGIDRSVVFGMNEAKGASGPVYAYSVHAADPTKFVRESQDGSKALGRMANGKFKVLTVI